MGLAEVVARLLVAHPHFVAEQRDQLALRLRVLGNTLCTLGEFEESGVVDDGPALRCASDASRQ